MEPDAHLLSTPGKGPAWEKWLVALLLALLFLANFSIASRSPHGGWMDEMFMTDPGLNLATGKGWTSSAWRYQDDHAFWAQNSPLYPAGLAVWARAFDASTVSSRTYCYFLGTIGMFLFWLGTYRLRLLTPGYRLFWLVFLATEYSTNYMMRDARYDVWIFVGLSVAWVGVSLRRPRAKHGLIFLGCYLAPWAGFISLTYLFLMAGLTAVLTRFGRWREAITAAVAAVAGMLSVLGFYGMAGVVRPFWQQVQKLSIAGKVAQSEGLMVFLYPRLDYGIVVMILVLAALSLFCLKNRPPGCTPWLGLGWGVVILMPCIMLARGIFPTMYLYMLVVPLSLAILVLVVRLEQRWLRRGILILMGLLCFTGLPARMYASLSEWDYRDPRHIRDFVHAYVQPGDCVFTDYFFYFELRDYVRWYAGPMYCEVIPPDEAARVNVALVSDLEFPDLVRDPSGLLAIGGGWTKLAVFPTVEMRANTALRRRLSKTYTLYRRTPPAGTPLPRPHLRSTSS